MLGPGFRARTGLQSSMRFAKFVTVPTEWWLNFVVSCRFGKSSDLNAVFVFKRSKMYA